MEIWILTEIIILNNEFVQRFKIKVQHFHFSFIFSASFKRYFNANFWYIFFLSFNNFFQNYLADESIGKNSFLHEITTISFKQTKAPTRKIYLRNLTVSKGEDAIINCPLINHLIESDDDKLLKADHFFYENKHYNYKTVNIEHNFECCVKSRRISPVL